MNGGPVNLAAARLRRATLRFATLSGADLAAADLSGADLTDARLDGANLTNADVSNATLTRADLAGAKLSGANLRGAILGEARNLTAAQLAESMGDATTDLPPHLERPRAWFAAEAHAEPPSEQGLTVASPDIAPRSRGSTTSWLVRSNSPAEAAKVK
jgi:uncharacterized protein YjbI with pentapeptide repeats